MPKTLFLELSGLDLRSSCLVNRPSTTYSRGSSLDSPWITAKDLAESVPEQPPYAVEELLIFGAITELTARIKAGKSTFVGALLYAMRNQELLFGLGTTPAQVLYLTEEGPYTFSSMLAKTRLLDADNIHVLMRGKAPKGLTWPEMVSDVVLPRAIEVQATVVIVDTLSRWVGIKGDEENQTGAAQAAMEPLEELRQAKMAVLTVHHGRKGGGEIGENTRGASAWGGVADIILSLENPHTEGHPNRRILESLGRFHDPGKWTVDLEHGEYRLISTGDTAERQLAARAILSLEEPCTKIQIERITGYSRSTVDRALADMVRSGQMIRTGSGRSRYDPFMFSAPKPHLL